MNKDELKVLGLTQRIGEITSKYEEQIVDVRAEYTIMAENSQNRIGELEREIMELKERLGELDVVETEKV